VTDDTNEPPAGVPMRKAAAGRPDAAASAPRPPRPQTVSIAIVALGITALFSIIAALGWSSERDWIKSEVHKNNASAVASAASSASASAAKKGQDVAKASASASSSAVKKNPISASKVSDQAGKQVQSVYISSLFGVLVLGFLAYGAFKGRHWTRWGVTGFYVIATLTGIGFGLLTFVTSVLGSGAPLAIRLPTLVAALAMLVAVVLVNLRPSVQFFALSRPVPPAGAPQRRGLFGPRPPRAGQPQRAANTRPAAGGRASAGTAAKAAAAKDAERQRAKKRANADSVARGAELARSRAKASKSRRTER